MPGDGTSPVITTSNLAHTRLMDVTRLSRRAGRVLTGVDRVELAYVRALSADAVPCFGLAKTSFGYVLVRPDALAGVIERICDDTLDAPDLLSRLPRRMTDAQRRAETALRRAAVARCRPRGLAAMLGRHVKPGFAYLNTGHSNLTTEMLGAVKAAGGRATVFVHDVIPLECPEFQRHGTADRFAEKMQAVRAHADLIIANSADTAERTRRALGQWGDVPPAIVAHLGTETPPTTGTPPPVRAPYFVALGTIEPRKNIGFLLDLWEEMGADAPTLAICGARGWRSEDVFARLDALPRNGPIRELGALDDAQMGALLAGANGLVFPSLAEGFGIPAVEAARLGVPVLCSELAVFREILGNIPIYADVNDPYSWKKEIMRRAGPPAQNKPSDALDHLNWHNHFKIVLNVT